MCAAATAGCASRDSLLAIPKSMSLQTPFESKKK
jgi:hypothetical protein